MKKNLQKFLRGLLAGKIILSLLMALPPMGECVALSNAQNAGLDLQPEPAFTKLHDAAGSASFMPKSSQEATVSLSRWLQASFVALKARTILLCETKRILEFSDYLLVNDPRFNLPLLCYRQPAREHSSAG